MTADNPKNRGEHGGSGARTEAPRRSRVSLLVAAAAVTLAAVVAAVLTTGVPPGGDRPRVTSSGQAQVGGPFSMVDQDGRPVDQRILTGKWSAVFFGYTSCPDVCPATLQALAAAAAKLGSRAQNFQVVFVSVDPARDTPAQLKSYLANQAFPGHTIGLTGTPAQVGGIAKAYRAYYANNGSGPGYTVDHTAAIYLMNPQGRFDRVLSESFGPERIAQQIADAERGG